MVVLNSNPLVRICLCLPLWTRVRVERCRVGSNTTDFTKIDFYPWTVNSPFKKGLIATLIALVCGSSQAGFITGYVVGSAGKRPVVMQGEAQVVVSDKNDVISCPKVHYEQKCYVLEYGNITPAQYATYSGYKVLHKVGVVISASGQEFIVMEVSK